MSDEQLDNSDFGIRGIEKAAGYTEMPLADAPPQEDLAPDAAVENFIATRDDPAPIVERAFFDVTTREKRPETEVVSAEDAARNLANTRAAERQAVAEQQDRDLAEALDQLRGQEQQPVAADEQSAGRTEPQQPDWEVQAERDHATYQQATAEIDKNIEALLSDPNIRSRLEHEFGQVRAEVDQAKGQYQQATAQLAQEALATMAALVPEIQGMTPDQARGALALMAKQDPQRVAALQQLMGRSQNILAAHQQQVAQQQAQQRQQAEDTFRQFAAEQDARVLTNDPPETVAAIRNGLLAEARAAGISEKELMTVYNTNSAMRHSFVQNLVAQMECATALPSATLARLSRGPWRMCSGQARPPGRRRALSPPWPKRRAN